MYQKIKNIQFQLKIGNLFEDNVQACVVGIQIFCIGSGKQYYYVYCYLGEE